MRTHSLPAHRARSFVSATRVLAVLQQRLGCAPTGDRGSGSEYWLTPNGVRFRVTDPTADYESAPVVSATGRRSLYYSYQYAAALLHYVSWLTTHGRPEDETPKAHDDSILVVEHRSPAEPRPLWDLADTIFI